MGQITANTPARQVIAASEAEYLDLIFHKSVHIVSLMTLKEIAMDPTTVTVLRTADLGSAAVGFPPKAGILQTATTYLKLITEAATAASSSGHNIGLGNFPALVAFAMTKPMSEPATEAWMVNTLTPAVEMVKPVAAWCFGYYTAMLEEASIRANEAAGSLLRSYALKSLKSSSAAMYAGGMKTYQLDTRAEREKAAAGNPLTVNLAIDPAVPAN
jgi:hypothetical protein